MSHSFQIAIVALGALLVGTFLPLLWSAMALLRRTRETVDAGETQAQELAKRTAEVLDRVDRIVAGVEHELPTLRRTAERVDDLGSSLEQLTQTVKKIQSFTAMIGPAVAAGVQAYRAVKAARAPVDGGEEDPLPEEVTDAILSTLKAETTEQSDPPPDSAARS